MLHAGVHHTRVQLDHRRMKVDVKICSESLAKRRSEGGRPAHTCHHGEDVQSKDLLQVETACCSEMLVKVEGA